MKKKILIHAPNLATPGGKQTYYAAIQSYFKSDVSFFFYGANGQKESKIRTLSRLISDYRLFYKQVKKGNFDLVHLNPSLNFKSFFRDSIFVLICKWLRVKTLVFWHGWNWDFEKKWVQKMKWFFRRSYGKTDAMMVLAKEFEAQLLDYGYSKKIFLETTVVDDTIFDLAEASPKNYSPSEGEPLILLFLARLEKVKGIYEAINSFEKLQRKHSNTVLQIAGTGAELDAAKKYVADKKIDNINFLGWITGAAKAQVLIDAHIYILASYHGEGMPISLLEAMATGTAVVTTDVGGIKDFFENKQMGHLVKAKDTNDLEEKLKLLIKDPSQMDKMAHYNVAYAKKRFTPAQVCERIEQIYTEVVNGKKHPIIAQNDLSYSNMNYSNLSS